MLFLLVHTVLTDGGSTCGNVSTGTCQPNKDCIEPTCTVLKSFPTTNISECCLACTTLPNCAVYTLHTGGGGNCFLRSAATKPVPGTCTTGVIHLQPPPPPPPPLPPSSAKNVSTIFGQSLAQAPTVRLTCIPLESMRWHRNRWFSTGVTRQSLYVPQRDR